MAEQAFLSSCITAEKTSDVDITVLDHSALRTGISMGMMPAIAIPATLSSMILLTPSPRHRAPPATPSEEPPLKRPKAPRERERERDPPRDRPSPGKRTELATRTVPASWKIITDNGNHFFALSTSLGPLDAILKCPAPSLCGKFLLRGRCLQTGCPRGASHAIIQSMDSAQSAATKKWFQTTCQDRKMA
jgi:hypothetical protein